MRTDSRRDARRAPRRPRHRPLLALGVALCLIASPGCMTIFATGEDGLRVYAGTRMFFKDWPMSMRGVPAGPVLGLTFNVLAPFDLPLSVALDTLMLPVTGVAALIDAMR